MTEAWETTTIGTECTTFSGGTPATGNSEYYGGNIPWITSSDLNRRIIYSVDGRITKLGLDRSSAKMVKAGTPLIALYGATAGVPALTKIEAAINQAVLAMVPKRIDGEFLVSWLGMNRSWIIDTYTQGGQPNLSGAIVRSVEIPLQPFEEQRRISETLRDVDDLISSLVRLIAKKRAIKKGMMQELLTGRTRLPGYSVSWSETRLGDVASGGRGAGLSKSSIVASGRNPCLLYGELFTTYSRVIESVKSFTNEVSGVRSVGGEVLLPGSTTTTAEDLATASALLQRGVLLGGDVNIIRPNRHKIDSVWLAYYLTNQLKNQIAEAGQGITIVHLYVRSLLTLEIELPPLPEQIAIGSALQDADAEIEALERRLETTRDIKQGMMQELLTGRTRLPVDEEVAV